MANTPERGLGRGAEAAEARQKPRKPHVEGLWKVYGPYVHRDGSGLYAKEVLLHQTLLDKDGKPVRKERSLGRVGDAYQRTIHVDADLDFDVLEAAIEAVVYANQWNMGKQRIVKPLSRLLRKLGLHHYTDEEVPRP